MLSDKELSDLKKRCMDAMGSGATIARHPEYMLDLIKEVEKHREAACCPEEPPTKRPAAAAVKMTVKGDLNVEHAPAPAAAEKAAEDKKPAKSKAEKQPKADKSE